jgi:hypothetical protein
LTFSGLYSGIGGNSRRPRLRDLATVPEPHIPRGALGFLQPLLGGGDAYAKLLGA